LRSSQRFSGTGGARPGGCAAPAVGRAGAARAGARIKEEDLGCVFRTHRPNRFRARPPQRDKASRRSAPARAGRGDNRGQRSARILRLHRSQACTARAASAVTAAQSVRLPGNRHRVKAGKWGRAGADNLSHPWCSACRKWQSFGAAAFRPAWRQAPAARRVMPAIQPQLGLGPASTKGPRVRRCMRAGHSAFVIAAS
jgi:hypothetical protein